jgi:hypothetical protein
MLTAQRNMSRRLEIHFQAENSSRLPAGMPVLRASRLQSALVCSPEIYFGAACLHPCTSFGYNTFNDRSNNFFAN